MFLRRLELNDVPRMLSWMHDADAVRQLHADFASKTMEDAERFIRSSWSDQENLHLAIASEEGLYMGTVSLKHIQNGSAEFGIAMCRDAMGRGYAWFGMESILQKAFDELGLESVYWCVSRLNHRAVRFYDKHNFHEALDIPAAVLERYRGQEELKWYSVLRGDVLDERQTVAGCRIVHIKTVPTINAGELSFFEGTRDIPFEIKRIYFISKVPEGVRRGFHAHRTLKQLLFCPYGRIQLVLENELGREEIELSDPSIGVVIDRPTWREMLWLQKDSVLCVAASEFYDPEDYIRDRHAFERSLLGEVKAGNAISEER